MTIGVEHQLHRETIRDFVGWGDPVSRATPLHAWRPVFERLLGIEDVAGSDERRERALATLSEREPLPLAPLLASVIQVEFEPNEHTRNLEGEGRARAIRQLLVQLLETETRRGPVVVVLDDAHWLDSASSALAAEVASHVEGLLLVLVSRPVGEAMPTATRRLVDRADVHIVLDGLDEAAEGELIAGTLAVASVPPHLAAWVRRRTLGNPFFSQELALALRDNGVLRVARGQLHDVPPSVELDAAAVPITVEGIVGSRIDRMTPRQQLLLKAASVIGPSFTFANLRAIYPIAEDRDLLAEDLEALRAAKLIHREGPLGGADVDMFRHRITMDVTYNMMPTGQRRQLHRAAAEWFESETVGDSNARLALLAHHWDRADDAPKAFAYLEQAGARMLIAGEYRAAGGFLDRAIARDDTGERDPDLVDDSRRARWHRELADARLGLGEFAECGEHLNRTLALCRHPLPAASSGWKWLLLGQVSIQLFHLAVPWRWRASPRRAERLAEAARAATILAEKSFYDADGLAMATASFLAVNLSERSGSFTLCARSFAYAGLFAGLSRLHGLARRYFARARRIAEDTADHRGGVITLIIEGNYQLCFARWAEATAAYSEAHREAKARGLTKEFVMSECLFAVIDTYRGDFPSSLEGYVRTCDLGIQEEDEQVQVWGRTGMAHELMILGRFEDGFAELEALGRLKESGTVDTLIITGGLRAIGELRRGRVEGALELADETLARIGTVAPRFTQLSGHAAPAEVYADLWEDALSSRPDRVAALARRTRAACRALRDFAQKYPMGKPRALLSTGRVHQLSGQVARARKAWQRARQLAAATGMTYDEAMANFELGRHAPHGADSRGRDLERAIELFEAGGCAYHAWRARLALEGQDVGGTAPSPFISRS